MPYGTMVGMQGSELPEYAERVLQVAEQIPPGRVMTYGDVAAWLREEDAVESLGTPQARKGRGDGPHGAGAGGGPRQVGRVMALYGGAVPWWRVVRSDGVLLPGEEHRALERYRTEGTPLREPRADGAARPPRLDMRRARWGLADG